MNSKGVTVTSAPIELDDGLEDDTSYAIQNLSSTPVRIISKDIAADRAVDGDKAKRLFPAGDESGKDVGFIKPKSGFTIYAWAEGSSALVSIDEAV